MVCSHLSERSKLGGGPVLVKLLVKLMDCCKYNLLKLLILYRMAEREGFEPSVPARGTTVFETAPIDRSGTSPLRPRVIEVAPCHCNKVAAMT